MKYLRKMQLQYFIIFYIQVEINPLVLASIPGSEKRFYCADAKFNFDDDSKFRNKELFELKDIVLI